MGLDGAPEESTPSPATSEEKTSLAPKADNALKTPEKKKKRQRKRKKKGNQQPEQKKEAANSSPGKVNKKSGPKNGKNNTRKKSKKKNRGKRKRKNGPKGETEEPTTPVDLQKNMQSASFKLIPAPPSPARKPSRSASNPNSPNLFSSFPLVPPSVPLQMNGTTFFGSTPLQTGDPYSLLHIHNPLAIMKQVEWYFKDENLEHDIFLCTRMDARGYVPIDLICSFRRLQVHGITAKEIETCCAPSTLIKIKNGAIKKRHNWYKYVLPGDKVTSIVASDDEAEFAEAERNSQPRTKSYNAEEFFDLFRKKKPEEDTKKDQTAV